MSVQSVCDEVRVEREKSILKQGAVQHLYGRLAGTLKDDAGDASLLVCLLPRCPAPHSILLLLFSTVALHASWHHLSVVSQGLCSVCLLWQI